MLGLLMYFSNFFLSQPEFLHRTLGDERAIFDFWLWDFHLTLQSWALQFHNRVFFILLFYSMEKSPKNSECEASSTYDF